MKSIVPFQCQLRRHLTTAAMEIYGDPVMDLGGIHKLRLFSSLSGITVEVGINVEGEIFWKKLGHKCNKRGVEGGKNLRNQ